ncbi:MAG: hypothetical protein JNL98_33220 [Bryobacterales bacterium]|nr:hypothetical protein [Bryobacterales bacterium]
MRCFRGMIIATDQQFAGQLEKALHKLGGSLYLRTVVACGEPSVIEAQLQAQTPSIVFVDLTHPDYALEAAALVHSTARHAQIIGFGRETSREALMTIVRGGMRDILCSPFAQDEIRNVLDRVFRLLSDNPYLPGSGQHIVSFLPAKAGCGASTAALQTAFAISRFGKGRTALLDLDFDCGVIDFMLKLPFGLGLTDIIEYGAHMDETIWNRIVSKYGNLDVLRSGQLPLGERVSAAQAEHVLDFSRRKYDVVCVDLPGPGGDLAASVMAQSSHILLLCTPELSALHLARRRLEDLKVRGLSDRVKIVLNRYSQKAVLRRDTVEDVLGAEVSYVIANDYASLQTALTNGRPVDVATPLGRAFNDMANAILGVRNSTPKQETPSSIWSTVRGLLLGGQRSKKSEQRQPLALPPPDATPHVQVLGDSDSSHRALITWRP